MLFSKHTTWNQNTLNSQIYAWNEKKRRMKKKIRLKKDIILKTASVHESVTYIGFIYIYI